MWLRKETSRTVWYYPNGIANILSLINVKKKYRVTYESELNNGFIVQKWDGVKFMYRPSKSVLFYLEWQMMSGQYLLTL